MHVGRVRQGWGLDLSGSFPCARFGPPVFGLARFRLWLGPVGVGFGLPPKGFGFVRASSFRGEGWLEQLQLLCHTSCGLGLWPHSGSR